MLYPLIFLLVGLSSLCSAQPKQEDNSGEEIFLPCWYQAKQEKEPLSTEFKEHKNCAYYNNKQIVFNAEILKNISFNQDKLAIINFSRQFFYLNQFGESAAVVTYDNWADDFRDGLARTKIDNKIGYLNKKLKIVIPADYDWAFPFENGTAVICMGCQSQPMGEHQYINGGMWGKIDINGNLIEPLTPR